MRRLNFTENWPEGQKTSNFQKLRKIYRKTYRKEPQPPDVSPVGVYPILDKFERVEDAIETLQTAMESERLTMEVYQGLAQETDDPELGDLYKSLVKVRGTTTSALRASSGYLKNFWKRGGNNQPFIFFIRLAISSVAIAYSKPLLLFTPALLKP